VCLFVSLSLSLCVSLYLDWLHSKQHLLHTIQIHNTQY
jgi:hypothetical protein